MLVEEDIPVEFLQKSFAIPIDYQSVFALNLTNIKPWYFIGGEEYRNTISGLQSRYAQYLVLPFAKRQDNDDTACIVVQSTKNIIGNVIILHDFATAGYEIGPLFASFREWFMFAIGEMFDWNSQT